MTEAAQEDLTGMPTPKQDERTPGRFWVECRDGRWQVQTAHRGPCSSFCVAQINHWADDGEALAYHIAESCNAYTSTEALRSALQACAEFLRNKGIPCGAYSMPAPGEIDAAQAAFDRELEAIIEEMKVEVPRMVEQRGARAIDTALSGSPAPSKTLGYVNVYRNDDGTLELGSADLEETPDFPADAEEFAEFVGKAKVVLIDARASPAPSIPVRVAEPMTVEAEVQGNDVCRTAGDDSRDRDAPLSISSSPAPSTEELREGVLRAYLIEAPSGNWLQFTSEVAEADKPLVRITPLFALSPAPDAARTALAGVTAPATKGAE